jgi:hypothetical protein
LETLGWAGVALGTILVLAALCPLPVKRRRQSAPVRLILAALGVTTIGNEGQDLQWSDRLLTPLAAAALALWLVAAVRIVWLRRNRRG